ncbi:MAG: hypothetical protein JSR62_03295 [Nitrospira sp.]|nr:hypothetical protein [Nitrospira sp.]
MLNFLLKWQHLPFGRPSNHLAFVGNTAAQTDPVRIADAHRAIDTFLARVGGTAGLLPQRILFAVDGMRPHIYDATGSYFDVVRRYFMEQARRRGFEVLDLQPQFIQHFAQYQHPMKFPTDNHWNSLGHEVAEQALTDSALYGWFRSLAP